MPFSCSENRVDVWMAGGRNGVDVEVQPRRSCSKTLMSGVPATRCAMEGIMEAKKASSTKPARSMVRWSNLKRLPDSW